MRCVEDDCELDAKGYDIEKAYDQDNQPIYAVTYECPEGHKFVAEYERALEEDIIEEDFELRVPEEANG
jgi:hypothetical protein